MRKYLSLITSAALLAQIFVFLGVSQPASAAIPECSATMTAQNNLKVAPGHGKVFYVDTGLNPKLDAAYVAYKVTNTTGSVISPYVVLESFSGGNVSLANPLDSAQQIREIGNSSAKTAFFLLKSAGGTTTPQSHIVKVYANNPAVDTTPLVTCSFTFQKVTETIKANANKIESVSHVYSGGSARIGGTITTTVNGKTGTVGAGSSPDFSAFWASPAAFSSWPTRSLRLESTSILMDCTNPTPNITLTNELFASNASSCFSNPSATWTGTYVFRILGGAAIAPVPSPVAQIASGTKYKHSDTAGISGGGALTTLTNLTPSGVVVSHSGVVSATTSTTVTVRYTTTISSTIDAVVDELYDQQITWSGTVTYVAGSLTRNGASITDAANLSSERLNNPPLLRFFGPLTVTSNAPLTYTYQKTYQCGTTAKTAAFAKIGDTTFGSENYTLASASLVSSTTGGGDCIATITASSEQLDPLVRTDPATPVATTTATLQGFVDPYGVANTDYRFSYSTDPNLISGVITGSWVRLSATTPSSVSQAITGLTPGTTYYYRTELKSSGEVFEGAILSFRTLSVQALPTVNTLPATSISTTTATLNGEIDPNLTNITAVKFAYSTNQSMTSPTTTSAITILDEGSTVTLTLSGDGNNEVSQGITGLTSGTTYYFRVVAECVADATFCPGGVVLGNVMSFTAGAPTVTTEPATNIGATSASISSIVTFGSNVSHKFVFCKSGESFTGVVSGTATTCAADTVADSPFSTSAVTLTTPSGALTTASLSSLDSGARYFYFAIGASAANSSLKSSGRVLFFDTLNITTGSLPGGQSGVPYQQVIAGTGGSGSYVWSISSGNLPAGLTLDSNGVISGTPTGAATTQTFTVEMYDPTNGTRTTKQFTITITAPVQVTVTFSNNVSAGYSTTSQTAAGATNLTLNGFTRNGYVFAGWATTPTGSVSYVDGETFPFTSDATLYAVWAYAITYDYDGGTGTPPSQSVIEGTSITLPAATRNGYSLLGWTVNGTPSTVVADPYTPTSAVTLVASWSNTLTITFDSNYGTPSTQVQSAQAGTVTLQANPFSRSNYGFAGWATSRTGPVVYANSANNFNLTQNTTLYARWTSLVTYDYNGGSGSTASDLVLDGNLVTLPTPDPRTSYDFNGWTVQGTPSTLVSSNYLPTGAVTLVASWSSNVVINNSLTITFDGNFPSSGQQTQTANAGSVTLNNNGFTRPGFTFAGWATTPTGAIVYQNGGQIQLSGSVTLYAIWTEVQTFTVTYIPEVSGLATITESMGVSGNLRANTFQRDGFFFNGWATTPGGRVAYTDGQAVTLTGNLTLYALWWERGPVVDPYRVTYTFIGSDGGVWPDRESSPVTFTHTIRDNISLFKANHRFVGWYNWANPNQTFRVGERLFVDTSYRLAPLFKEIGQVTFTNSQANGGLPPASISGLVGDPVTIPANPNNLRRDGHQFGGWRDSRTQPPVNYRPGDVINIPAGGLVLDPIWEPNGYYELLLDLGYDDKKSIERILPQGPDYRLQDPVRPGYRFDGWFDAITGQRVLGPIGPGADRHLIAQWTRIPRITLDFNGVAPGITQLEYIPGSPGITPPTPQRPGYRFLGWVASGNPGTVVGGELKPTSDLTLVASWELITYTVRIQHFSNPALDLTIEYQPGAEGVELPSWARKAFSFRGWTTSEQGLNPFFGTLVPTEDVQLYSSWTITRTVFFTGDSDRITPTTQRTLNDLSRAVRGALQTLHVSTVGWVKETSDKSYDARLSRSRALSVNAYLRRSLTFNSAQAVGRGIFGVDSPISRRAEVTIIVTGARRS